MADIFREIDEDLRRDRLLRVWQRYAAWIIAAAVLLVVGAAVFAGWQNWQARRQAEDAARYAGAIEQARSGNGIAAVLDLQALGRDSSGGYGLLARIEAAALKAQGKDADKGKPADRAAGLAALLSLAGDSSIDQSYRDLATILWGLFAVDTVPRDAIDTHLAMLAGPGPWRLVSAEIMALADLRAGDRPAAIKRYQDIADDLEAPQTQRARAAEIITDLKD